MKEPGIVLGNKEAVLSAHDSASVKPLSSLEYGAGGRSRPASMPTAPGPGSGGNPGKAGSCTWINASYQREIDKSFR